MSLAAMLARSKELATGGAASVAVAPAAPAVAAPVVPALLIATPAAPLLPLRRFLVTMQNC